MPGSKMRGHKDWVMSGSQQRLGETTMIPQALAGLPAPSDLGGFLKHEAAKARAQKAVSDTYAFLNKHSPKKTASEFIVSEAKRESTVERLLQAKQEGYDQGYEEAQSFSSAMIAAINAGPKALDAFVNSPMYDTRATASSPLLKADWNALDAEGKRIATGILLQKVKSNELAASKLKATSAQLRREAAELQREQAKVGRNIARLEKLYTQPLLDSFWQKCNRDVDFRYFVPKLKQSVAFQIDAPTVNRISDLMQLPEEDIQRFYSIARAPYETTWIEVDFHAKEKYQIKTGATNQSEFDELPYRMGYLIESYSETGLIIHTIQGPSSESEELGPILTVHIIETDPEKLAPTDVLSVKGLAADKETGNRTAVRAAKAISWGTPDVNTGDTVMQSIGLPDWIDRQYNIGLTQHYLDKIKKIGKENEIPRLIKSTVENITGDIRWIVCALAAINELPTVVSDKTSSPGNFTGRKSTHKFLSHRTIQLKIGRTVTVSRMSKMLFTAAKKKAHRVRRHMRVYHRGTDKERIVWIEPHVRGDASLGWVHQDYEVVS